MTDQASADSQGQMVVGGRDFAQEFGPVFGPETGLDPAWIDYNNHLNMAYYTVIFDQSIDTMLERVGLDSAYRAASGCSVMTAEIHVNYIRELLPDARVRVGMRFIDADEKRLHVYQELYHVEGWLAATCESMVLHVDLGQRKVVAMPDDMQARIQAMLSAHQALPPTKYMGRTIGIRRKG